MNTFIHFWPVTYVNYVSPSPFFVDSPIWITRHLCDVRFIFVGVSTFSKPRIFVECSTVEQHLNTMSHLHHVAATAVKEDVVSCDKQKGCFDGVLHQLWLLLFVAVITPCWLPFHVIRMRAQLFLMHLRADIRRWWWGWWRLWWWPWFR